METEFFQLDCEASPRTSPQDEDGVEISFDMLNPETLEQLIKSFVLREGTDYGEVEVTLARKIEEVRSQLERGVVKIVFDLSTESTSIIPKR